MSAIRRARYNAFEQAEYCSHFRLLVNRGNKLHFRCSWVGETNLDPGIAQRLDECLSSVYISCSNLLPFESTVILRDDGITMDDDGILHLLQLPDRGR